MNRYTIPINMSVVESLNPEEDYVDMSELDFPIDPTKQKRAAFLFIRNTNLVIPMKFGTCSYKDRCEYMLLYYQGDISVRIPELDVAWLEMLLYRANMMPSFSLFTYEEMQGFISANKQFVDEVLRVAISIPLCSIDVFLSGNKNIDSDISMAEFEHSDWCGLNFDNFAHLFDYPAMLSLTRPVDGIRPVIYDKYFTKDDNPYIGMMMEKLPYLNMLNAMLYDTERFKNLLKSFVKGVAN